MTWTEISGDTLVKAGETYQTIHRFLKISGDAPESEILRALTTVPWYDIENEIEVQHHIDVTIKSITAKKVSADTYDQAITFECVTNAIPIIWIAVIVASIVAAYVATLIAVNLDKIGETFKIQTPFGDVNTFAIIIVIVAVIILLMILKR